MTKYIDRYYLNGEEYGIKFGGGGWQPGANCLAYYHFKEDGLDYSGNNNDCTITGCQFGTVGDKYGVQLQTTYSGSPTNYIDTSLTYTQLPLSICVWAYPTLLNDWQEIMGNSTSDNSNNFRMRVSNTTLTINAYGQGDQSLGTYSTNQWYCFGITIDQQGNGILYVNGEQVNTFNSGTTTSSAGIFKYGHGTGWGSFRHPRVGWIRESAIFNSVLSAAEMLDFYNKTA